MDIIQKQMAVISLAVGGFAFEGQLPGCPPEKFPKMPFDMKRFTTGGFKVLVQSR